jgi:hypothetical protein
MTNEFKRWAIAKIVSENGTMPPEQQVQVHAEIMEMKAGFLAVIVSNKLAWTREYHQTTGVFAHWGDDDSHEIYRAVRDFYATNTFQEWAADKIIREIRIMPASKRRLSIQLIKQRNGGFLTTICSNLEVYALEYSEIIGESVELNEADAENIETLVHQHYVNESKKTKRHRGEHAINS